MPVFPARTGFAPVEGRQMKKRILALCFALIMSLAILPIVERSASADTAFVQMGTVYGKPVITTQPASKTVKNAKTATFKVVASGASSYQWQYSKDNGATWKTWKGKTSATLKVTASVKNNGTLYRCIVKNGVGSVTSKKARLTVSNVKPRVMTQPVKKTVASGKTATFKVVAWGTAKTYQWQYSKDNGVTWKTYKNKTSATLKVKGTVKTNGTMYRCVVKNKYGSTKSTGALLTVSGVKPAIITQPVKKKAAVGTKVTFKVVAAGTGLKYKWQYSTDGGETWMTCTETGYNKASFSFKTTRAMDGRLYRCVVKNSKGSVKSAAVKLTVPRYTAILIGEYDYSDGYLPGPENDYKAMAGMLGGLRSKYTIKKLPNATKSEMLSAIASYAKSSKSYDILYFFYSGHGTNAYMSEYQGALYTVDGNYTRTDELADALSAFKGKVVVLLNSCYSGAAIYRNGESENEEALDAFNQSVIDAFSGYTVVDEEPDSEEVESEELKLTEMMGELAESKFTVLTAARYDQTSSGLTYTSDGETLQFSIFARGIVEGMGCNYPKGKYQGSMPADTDSNSKVTLGEMYNSVCDYVAYWRQKYYDITGSDAILQKTQYYGTLSTVLFVR